MDVAIGLGFDSLGAMLCLFSVSLFHVPCLSFWFDWALIWFDMIWLFFPPPGLLCSVLLLYWSFGFVMLLASTWMNCAYDGCVAILDLDVDNDDHDWDGLVLYGSATLVGLYCRLGTTHGRSICSDIDLYLGIGLGCRCRCIGAPNPLPIYICIHTLCTDRTQI